MDPFLTNIRYRDGRPAYAFYRVLRLGWKIVVLGLMRPGVYWAGIARELGGSVPLTNKARDFINAHRRAVGDAVITGNWRAIEDLIFGECYRHRRAFKKLLADLEGRSPYPVPDWIAAREAIDLAPPLDPTTPIDAMIMEWLCGNPPPPTPEVVSVASPDAGGNTVVETAPPTLVPRNSAPEPAPNQPINEDGSSPPPELKPDPKMEKIDPDDLVNWVVPLIHLGLRSSMIFSDHGLEVLKTEMRIPETPKSEALRGRDDEEIIRTVVRYINLGARSEIYFSKWFMNAIQPGHDKKQNN